MQYVWYGAYGSNLSSDRLTTYLKGGRATGATRASVGARDSTPPTDVDTMVIGHQLGFGYESITWGGGGVAFLSPAVVQDASCLLRLHRVTLSQFEDIYSQENRRSEPVSIDLESLQAGLSIDLLPSLYGRLLHLGNHLGTREPVVTFTSSQAQALNSPSISYLKVIADGLADSHGLNESQIISYLGSALGMENWNQADWPLVLPSA